MMEDVPKMLKKVAPNVSVDAGLIFIGDPDILKGLGANRRGWRTSGLNTFFDGIEPGLYVCNYTMPNTANGRVTGAGVIQITSGTLMVADPCYSFNDEKWGDFLDDMRGDRIANVLICDRMGGDGGYKVEVYLQKVEKPPFGMMKSMKAVAKTAEKNGYFMHVSEIELQERGMHTIDIKLTKDYIAAMMEDNKEAMKKLDAMLKKTKKKVSQ